MGLPPPDLDPATYIGAPPRTDKAQEHAQLLESDTVKNNPSSDLSRRNSSRLANDSCYAAVAFSPLFQNGTIGVIVLNAIWIAVDTQWNHEELRGLHKADQLPLSPFAEIIENIFCTFFVVELTIRFFAFKKKIWCVFDAWFVFDGFLVLFMVIETWIMTIVEAIQDDGGGGGALSSFSAFRLLRLLRLTRMVRIMRAVPELMTLVKGIAAAARAVSFILIFLVLIIYVFAIVFTSQIGEWYAPERGKPPYYQTESDPLAIELFGTIGDSMMTLFTRGVLGDNLAETLQAIKDRGGACPDKADWVNGTKPSAEDCDREGGGSLWLFWLFIVFFIITALTLLNMLIGVLCEVIDASAKQEEEQSQISELRANMTHAFNLIDSSQDGLITRSEWGKMMTQKNFRSSMKNLGVEEQHMDERLDQMQESLFGSLERIDEVSGGPDEVVPLGREMTQHRVGLSFEQFMAKVVEIRPDTPASALDIEILRVSVEREEKALNKRLDNIDGVLAKLLKEVPPATTSGPPPAFKSHALPVGGTDHNANSWLHEVPTEVLFSVLKSRAPPELGTPKIIVDSTGGGSNFR